MGMSLASPDGVQAQEPRPSRLAPLRHVVSTTRLQNAVVGSMLGLMTWPVGPGFPAIDIDTSWIVGLHLAAQQRLQFGHDIAFTFGPLGFLGYSQPYLGWTSALALAFVGGVHIAVCISLFHLARQALGTVRALVFVFLTAGFLPVIAGWLLYGVLVFIAAAAAVLRHGERPTGSWFALGMGLAAAVACLGKLSVGAESLVICTVAVGLTAREPRRSFCMFLASFGFFFLGLWLALGGSLWDIPAYVRAAYEVSLGYSESMGLPATRWIADLSVMSGIILASLLLKRSAESSRRDRFAGRWSRSQPACWAWGRRR